MADDATYMSRALALAEQGLGRVAPNPSVGCVIVRGGEIVGAGRTQDGGRPHAEAVALEQAGERSKGATVYVTLEPCFHDDKPSCSSRLIEAGVAKVVVGCRDQNPAINGRGIYALKQSGIEVVEGVMEEDCAALNRGFFLSKTADRPFVTLKIATSLDSKIATVGGHSQWITGEEARENVHRTRARHDAILTGIGTLLADDCILTTRVEGVEHTSIRVVLDTHARFPKDANMAKTARSGKVIIYTKQDVEDSKRNDLESIDVTVRGADISPTGGLSIPFILQDLAAQGVTRLLVEAGQGIFTSFLTSGQWDELHLYRAPILIGSDGRDAFGGLGVTRIDQALLPSLISRHNMGCDVLEIYRNF